MDIKIKLNNPEEQACLGIFWNKTMLFDDIDDDDEDELNLDDAKEGYVLIIGVLIFSIEIVWET